MNFAELSIRRPVFITSILTLLLVAGYISLKSLAVDLFPNVTFPVVIVSVPYPGAGPAEVETLVAKPLEDEISTISGLKRLTSINQEGVGTVVGEFTLETDIKYAEDKIREAVTRARTKLPKDVDEPIIRRIDPSDQPVLTLSLKADLEPKDLYDLADEVLKPKLEQVSHVGQVEVLGGRKREIEVYLDRAKLKEREISASQVAARIQASGENIPVGKTTDPSKELVFRSLGQFIKISDIKSVIVNFFQNDVPVTVGDIGDVVDGLKDEKSRTYINGEQSLFINVYRQTGSNTVAVVEALEKKIAKINEEFATTKHKGHLDIIRDGSIWIKSNVTDVRETIIIGIVLAVVVVFLFLGSIRSTIITAMALPNSLIGAFILMAMCGFSINIMTLLALSLSVGLLIDDAIVVRENIFRHLEMGKSPIKAAIEGTNEVRLAVIATTFTVLAVFGPVGFLKGIVGQFFKEFGLTVCFALMISLFDALTIAPMLSAYLTGLKEKDAVRNLFQRQFLDPIDNFMTTFLLGPFDRFQTRIEKMYVSFLGVVLKNPIKSILIAFSVFLLSLVAGWNVTKTFLPAQDAGEFLVAIDLPPGSSLEKTNGVALQVDKVIRANPEVEISAVTVGNVDGDATVASSYVKLVPYKNRTLNTSEFKEKLRGQLVDFAYANPQVEDFDPVGAGQRPFNLNIVGNDTKLLESYCLKLLKKLKAYKGLRDVDVGFRPGKPEFQVQYQKGKQEAMGVSSVSAGQELRILIDGATPAKFRENDREYDIRVRLQEDQRDLRKDFNSTYVPNINGSLVPLSRIANPVSTEGPSKITREDRSRYALIAADLSPGAGFADILDDVTKMMTVDEDTKLPPGLTYEFIGQAENFKELGENMMMAMGLGILFIYFVLASLYESFVTPFTIMMALPMGIAGCFFALLVTHESLNIFSWIGVIMLLGVSTKNSILLVDYAHQQVAKGMSRSEALIKAGSTRLRPILMTTFSLIAGTLPLAIGLNEASRQRTSMGIAIIGGLVSSTLLTLIVVPAAYSFIDRFRVWSLNIMKRIFSVNSTDSESV